MVDRKSKINMKKIISSFFNTLLYAIVLSMIPTTAYGVSPIVAIPIAYAFVEVISLIVPRNVLGVDAYADTVLQNARAFIKSESNKKFELRPEMTRILDVFMKNREFTIPALSAIREADTQVTEALYLKKKEFTISTSGKVCAPTGEQSGSAKLPVTWLSKSFEVKTSFKQHAGNEVSMATAFANDLFNAEVSLFFGATGLDATLLAVLETNKSGVNVGGSGSFDAVQDIMHIDPSDEDDFYNLATADMMLNNYNPTFLDVHDTMWTAKQRRFVNQGGGNSTNLAFQFAGFEFFASNLITPGVIGANTYSAIHYIIPTGGVAILDWNDKLNRMGDNVGDKTWSTFESLLVPGLTYDVIRTDDCADTTADGGGKQDKVTVWQFTLNYATLVQPTPTGSPIFKYGNGVATFI